MTFVEGNLRVILVKFGQNPQSGLGENEIDSSFRHW
jgi:hypothetical protein